MVVVDKENKVKEIEGTENLRTRAEKVTNSIAREELKDQFGADRLKASFAQELRILPDVAARTGEPWERTETLEINGKTLAIRKKYEYRGTEKKGKEALEKITYKVLDVKLDQNPNGTLPLKVVKNDLKVESSEGTILFTGADGHVVSANERIRIKGELNYSGGGSEQNGTLELTFDRNTQLEPAAK